MAERSHFPRSLYVYVAIVATVAAVLLIRVRFMVQEDSEGPLLWGALTLLVAIAAHVKIDLRASVFSAVEIVFIVMLFALSPGQILVSIALGTTLTQVLLVRGGLTKTVFNISEYTVGAGAALAVWSVAADQGAALSLQDAWAAGLASLTLALVSLLLVDGVVAFAEGSSFRDEVRATFTPIWVISHLTSITLGLVFAAAYLESKWTLLLLPAILAEIYLGYHLYQNATVLAVEVETDPLTKLSNRRRFDKDLASLVSGDAVIIADLDHFKQVNDQHGHDAGDMVLQSFGRCLRMTVRENDSAARLGGEEFALLIKGGGEAGAGDALDRLRKMWAATDPEATFSAGVAVHSRSELPTETLKRADEVLLLAKARGRDRTEFSEVVK